MGIFNEWKRIFFSASNDIKTLDGNIFSGFPWLTAQLVSLSRVRSVLLLIYGFISPSGLEIQKWESTRFHKTLT